VAQTSDQLLKRFKTLVIKRPSLLLGLWGEPGIGKTHTIQTTLLGLNQTHLSFHATSPLSELARALPKPKFLPVWADKSLEQLQAGLAIDTDQLIQVIVQMLSQLAPFVLHLEDIHELRTERLAALQQLALRLKSTRGVGLIVTSRNLPPAPFEAIKLEPLDFEQHRQLLETQVGTNLPVQALEWIRARAAGNPLFTLEFFKFLSRQGFVWNDGSRWHWRTPEQALIPATVEALIERVLSDALQTPELTHCLEARALLGHDPSRELWSKVASLTPLELQTARSQLERHGILRGQEFSHPLFAEVASNQMPAAKKRDYAQRAILELQDQNPVAASAFLDLAKPSAEQTRDLLFAAARASSSDVQEARFLARVIPFLTGLKREKLTLEVATKLRHVDVLAAFELAESILDSEPYQIPATLLVCELHAVQGRGVEAEKIFNRLPKSERTTARLIWIRALGHNESGALELLKTHPDALENADAEILYRAARALSQNAQMDRAERIVNQAFKASDLSLESRVWLLKASANIAYMRADFEGVERLELEIFERSSELGNLRFMDAAMFNRALALDVLGRQEERLECLETALRLCLELNDITAYVIAQVMYADSLHQTADYERSELMLLEALSQLERVDLTAHRLDAELHLAALYHDWRPPQGKLLALKYASAALEHARVLNTDRYLCEGLSSQALTLAWTGQAARALPLALEALEKAEGLNMPVPLSEALHSLGYVHWKLEQPDAATEAFSRAQSVARGYGHQALAERLGLMIDLVNQNPDSAFDRLQWFEARGLSNAANITRQFFPALSPNRTLPPERTGVFRLEVLGKVQISQHNRVLSIRGRKRLELLTLLLEARLAGRSEASRTELLGALYPNELYPNQAEDRATSSLKELVRNTRSSLGSDVIETTANGYALANITSDAEEFLTNNDSGLWRGAYLNGTPLEFGLDNLTESLSTALFESAKNQLETNPKEAARLGKILLEMDAYNIFYLRLCVQALRISDNHKSLMREYGAARERLLEVGEVLPEHWQDFLEPQLATTRRC
jgi:tetratricopeptide (TPR) repeat protein